MKPRSLLCAGLTCWIASTTGAAAINIVVDYSLDTNNFFSTQQRKDALEAAASRFSSVITSNLAAVGPGGTGTGTSAGWRIGFTHPGTGADWEISTATDFGSDPLAGAGAASGYGFSGLQANEWILFAGGRSITAAGEGGTGTGTNFTTTFDDLQGPLHRGLGSNGADTFNDLPRWGGAITFDIGLTWHFDLGTPASGGTTDFYSIALHEIGHALGLGTSWNDWQHDGSGNYTGANAVSAYNNDNGTSLSSLDLVSSANGHWKDGVYQSFLFPGGDPVGTVDGETKQDLLLEPTANFSGTQQRFELTNVDVASLEDTGWEVIPEPSSAFLAAFGMAAFCLRRRK